MRPENVHSDLQDPGALLQPQLKPRLSKGALSILGDLERPEKVRHYTGINTYYVSSPSVKTHYKAHNTTVLDIFDRLALHTLFINTPDFVQSRAMLE